MSALAPSEEWRTPELRQSAIQKITEVTKMYNVPSSSPADVENAIFTHATTESNYMEMIERLILSIRQRQMIQQQVQNQVQSHVDCICAPDHKGQSEGMQCLANTHPSSTSPVFTQPNSPYSMNQYSQRYPQPLQALFYGQSFPDHSIPFPPQVIQRSTQHRPLHSLPYQNNSWWSTPPQLSRHIQSTVPPTWRPPLHLHPPQSQRLFRPFSSSYPRPHTGIATGMMPQSMFTNALRRPQLGGGGGPVVTPPRFLESPRMIHSATNMSPYLMAGNMLTSSLPNQWQSASSCTCTSSNSIATISPVQAGNQSDVTANESTAVAMKLEELQIFVPSLAGMIDRLTHVDKEDKSECLAKLNSLFNILVSRNTRVSLQTLEKCHSALKTLFEKDLPVNSQAVTASSNEITTPVLSPRPKRIRLDEQVGSPSIPSTSCSSLSPRTTCTSPLSLSIPLIHSTSAPSPQTRSLAIHTPHNAATCEYCTAAAAYCRNNVANDSDDETTDRNTSLSLDRLSELFPDKSSDQLKYIYDKNDRSYEQTVEFILDGISIESLRNLAAFGMLSDGPTIEVDASSDWLRSAIEFYKEDFDEQAAVLVHIAGQPGIDTGGVRRQFFSVVLSKLSESMDFFDGPQNRLRPAFKHSLLSSGLLSTIGTLIAHSLILDGQGFPYMAEYVYYYLVGQYDRAVSCISFEDVGERVRYVLNKVADVTDFNAYENIDELQEMMDRSGCNLPLKLENKKAIIECILLNDALHKRMVYIDAFGKGLEVLGVKSLISLFPEVFKPSFVYDGELDSKKVKSLLYPLPPVENMDKKESRVWEYLLYFIDHAPEKELKDFLQFVTGSPIPVGTIDVAFCDDEELEAITAGTCGRDLILSTAIADKDLFVAGMKAVIPDISFTAP